MERRLFKKDLEIPYMVKDTKYIPGEGYVKTEQPYTSYLGYRNRKDKTVLNFIFTDTLQFVGFSRGRSSVKANYISQLGDRNEYEMFLSDFEELVLAGDNVNILSGEFCFRKQGANYGVVKLEELEF